MPSHRPSYRFIPLYLLQCLKARWTGHVCSVGDNPMECEMYSYLEWQLNVDPPQLQDFESKVWWDFKGPGPYPNYILPSPAPTPMPSTTPYAAPSLHPSSFISGRGPSSIRALNSSAHPHLPEGSSLPHTYLIPPPSSSSRCAEKIEGRRCFRCSHSLHLVGRPLLEFSSFFFSFLASSLAFQLW